MAEEILSKKLTITDVNRRLSMKTTCLESFPPFAEGQRAQDIWVEDEEGQQWPFRLIIRSGRYKKPVFSAGWLRFVKMKHLQAGLKVQLLKEVNGDVTGGHKYKIKLKRPVTLFNAVIGHAPCTHAV